MNTIIGERIAPTIVIVTIVTVIHMLPTCVGHPQNLLLPHPHSLLFAFIVVVQSIGRWSAETILETTERKVVYPVQHLVGTPVTNTVNLPRCLAVVHKNLMLGSRHSDKPRDKLQRPAMGRTPTATATMPHTGQIKY